MRVNEEFIKKVTTLSGDAGKKWLQDLPQIIKHYEQKWNIEVLSGGLYHLRDL